jgi:hypothetical protein
MLAAFSRSAFLGLALFGCVLVGAACGREKEAVTPPAAAPSAPAPAAQVAPPPSEAPVSPSTVSLPKGYPEDVPSYPGATPVASNQDGDEGMIVAFQSPDDSDRVFAFYKDELPRKGWQIEGEMSSEGQHMLIAGKEKRKASILLSSEDGKTEITVTVTSDAG